MKYTLNILNIRGILYQWNRFAFQPEKPLVNAKQILLGNWDFYIYKMNEYIYDFMAEYQKCLRANKSTNNSWARTKPESCNSTWMGHAASYHIS